MARVPSNKILIIREANEDNRETQNLRIETVNFTLNGKPTEVAVRTNEVLSEVLREKLELTGTKVACDEGTCGSCTVLVDGKAVYSCLLLAVDCKGKNIETIEGLGQKKELHLLQEKFVTTNSAQCGFCTPGMIMSAKGLLDHEPNPSKEEVKLALSGNICRCTDYSRYIDAVLQAAKQMRGEKSH